MFAGFTVDSKEMFGIISTLIVMCALLQTNQIRFRMINLIGSIAYTLYGCLIGLLSVSILNFICIFINIHFLRKLRYERSVSSSFESGASCDPLMRVPDIHSVKFHK